jgi:hypothetical protein
VRRYQATMNPSRGAKAGFGFGMSWLSLVLTMLIVPVMVQAAAKIRLDDTRWVSIGAGLRGSVNIIENAASSGGGYSTDFAVNNARLYVNGQIFKGVLATLTTEIEEDEITAVRLFNGIARFEFTEVFKVWLGRLTAPSDRANLAGPFFLLNLDFPFVSAFPAVFAGQNDGLAVWGELFDKRFKYQLGAFNGVQGPPTLDDDVLFAARLVYNFLDPELGYWDASTYYGSKKILAVGVTVQFQKDAAGTVDNPENFTGFNIDILFEYPLTPGVVTLGGAFYNYDYGNNPLPGQTDGPAFYVQGGFLFAPKIGIGQFQPVFRVQHFHVDAPATTPDTTHYDFGLNYIIAGFDARVMFEYTRVDVSRGDDRNEIKILAQVQF